MASLSVRMAGPRHCSSRSMQRSTALRCLYASASKAGGRPPAHRRALCHASRRRPLRTTNNRRGLTKTIGAPLPGSRGMPMGPADGGVHRDGPADVVTTIRDSRHRGQDPLPGSVHRPSDQSFVCGPERSQFIWEIAPGRAGPVLPGNGLKGAAVISPSPPAGRIDRHQRLAPSPHRIRNHSSDRNIRSTGRPLKETLPGTGAGDETPTA